LHDWLGQKLVTLIPRSKLAEAILYALNRRDELARFVNDRRIDLDTNPVERTIRPMALGRKNASFAGSEGGAVRWAIVASLIETGKLNGIEPFAWLRDALSRIIAEHPMARLQSCCQSRRCRTTNFRGTGLVGFRPGPLR